jgi:phosphohistidine phosphatase SixA
MKTCVIVLFVMYIIFDPIISMAGNQSRYVKLLDSKEPSIYFLRHALAPGVGDPQNFNVEDCSTQRNLSEEGQRQAVRIGKKIRDSGIKAPRVLSSQWCRCLETAELLGFENIQDFSALNSFFENFDLKDKQTVALEGWLKKQKLNNHIVLVTHQVNIASITGVSPVSGEMVVMRFDVNNKLVTVGTVMTD